MADNNSPVPGDEELVAAAIEELPYIHHAYQALLSRHYDLLFRFCFGYLRDRSDAEDACQMVMLKVFSGLRGFHGQSSFKTWLLRIATNTCYSQKAKTVRERDRTLPLDTDGLQVGEADDVSKADAFAGDRFGNMIDNLPAADRQLLNLRFIADLTLEEIAEIMGLGVSATKMRYYRALEKLGQRLERD